MFQHILIPLDGSTRSEAAIEHAVAIAQQFAGRITLLRAVQLPDAENISAENLDRIRDQQLGAARDYLEGWASKINQRGVQCQPIVVAGDPARSILGYAHRSNVDLVVMNSHGAGGLSGYVFGSVADKVVRTASCPVLVLHVRPTEEELREQEEREVAEMDATLTAMLGRQPRA
ncbi:MAG TPA: universal stress protein [Dehalococcoidia bacterium]|nr:universal stress protein [Dehalococcoidia bacterium]